MEQDQSFHPLAPVRQVPKYEHAEGVFEIGCDRELSAGTPLRKSKETVMQTNCGVRAVIRSSCTESPAAGKSAGSWRIRKKRRNDGEVRFPAVPSPFFIQPYR